MAAETTADRLMTVARSLRRRYAAVLSQWEVTPSQSRALRTIAELEPARPSSLADRLHIAARSATEVIDALESRGLVARGSDPADRRATTLTVTPKGRDLQRLLDQARQAEAERFFGALAEADRAELDRILGLLADDGQLA